MSRLWRHEEIDMNRFFNSQNQQNDFYNIQRQYKVARYDLLAIIAFSLINIILIALGQDIYFLFSAYIPFSLVLGAALATGRYPDEFYRQNNIDIKDYWGADYEMMEPMFGAVFGMVVVFALAILAFYLLCFFLSKKYPVWMIIASVIFGIDTLIFIVDEFSGGMINVIDVILHAIMITILIRGCIFGIKLKAYTHAEQNAQQMGFGPNGDPYYGNPQNGYYGAPNQDGNVNGSSERDNSDQDNQNESVYMPSHENPDLTPPGDASNGEKKNDD